MNDKGPFASAYQPADPQEFVHNLAKLYEEYGKAVAAFIEPRAKGIAPASSPTDTTEIFKTLSKVAESWLADPQRAVELQTKLWKSYIELWASALKRLMGEPVADVISPSPRDSRFKDPEWSRNIFFDFCKQLYLLTTRWAEEAVAQADGLDEHTKHKAIFYVRQIGAALSPSNFLLTNPELLHETLASNGENLVRGMQMLAEDIRNGKGDIKLRQTDAAQFKLGKNLAVTPGEVIFQNDLIQLIQYKPATKTVFKLPMLIVPPWINKFYILDLKPEKSMLKWLVDQGHTVFCISWVNPGAKLRNKSFENYLKEGVLAALDAVEKITGEKQVNAVGYCVGGTLLAAALAYLAGEKKQRIASATFFAAQVDFTYAGDLKVFIDENQIKSLEESMAKSGYLDSKRMATTFNMLRANELIWPYFVNNYLRGKQPSAFDLLYWNSDATRMAAANHSFYLRQCYMLNALSTGKMKIAGKKLNLKTITCPVYNVAPREDHIAPAQSVFFGSQFFGGPVTFVLSASGHIAGIINPPAQHKYEYWTSGKPIGALDDWIAKAKTHQGSWWPHWQAWLEKLDGKKVKARKTGSKAYPPLEPAPGSYVRVQG